MNPTEMIILASAIFVVVASWAFGHYGTAGIAAKLAQAKGAVASAEAKAGAVESAFAHPIDAIRNAEHAAVLKVADEAGKLIVYLTDKSSEQAARAAADRVATAKDKALDDLIAKLQQARQQ